MNSANNLWILRFRLNIMRRRPHPALNWIFKSFHDSNYSFVLMWFNINLSPFTGFRFRCFSPFYASDQWDFSSSLFFRPLCAIWRSRNFLTRCALWGVWCVVGWRSEVLLLMKVDVGRPRLAWNVRWTHLERCCRVRQRVHV